MNNNIESGKQYKVGIAQNFQVPNSICPCSDGAGL